MRRLNLIHLCMSLFTCCSLLVAIAQAQTIVRMETNVGYIDIDLYDTLTPATVTNFLNYVNSNRYDGTFIHRSVPDFIIQGGGYYFNSVGVNQVTAYPPLVNEYDPSRSNLRGTIAMAKLPSGPDTATSEWFFNLVDNSSILDVQNGGFTVFGRVMGDGMNVVDYIAALPILPPFIACPSPFDELPLLPGAPPNCPTLDQLQYLVTISSIRVIPYVQGNKAVILDYAGNYVSLAATESSVSLANVSVADNPAPAGTPNGVVFSEGFFDFQLGNLTVGGAATVVMQLPTGFLANTYYMYGPTPDNNAPHWYEFKFDGLTGAEFSANSVALHFVDGERGDADLTVNGMVGGFGAPGINNNAPVSFNRDDVGSLGCAWLLMLGLPLLISRSNIGRNEVVIKA